MKMWWPQLPKPIMCLAPMEGVTDAAFRRLVTETGKPDVMFSEFVSVEGLCSRGYPGMQEALWFTLKEQPIVAQIWGYTPEAFFQTAKTLVAKGFAGIDINTGCPDRAVMKKGGGAALIANEPLMKQIVDAVKEGVAGKVPVSVKTRLGIKQIESERWIRFLLRQRLDALTIHLRTVAELSKVPVHTEELKKAVMWRNVMGVNTIVIGNGDIVNEKEARKLVNQSGADGVMIGRGVLSNPWVFAKDDARRHSKVEKLKLLLRHVQLFEEVYGKARKIYPLRKYFKIYVNGFSGAVQLRTELMQAESGLDVRQLVHTALERKEWGR